MESQTIFAALRDALAALYPAEQNARVVVADAGLDATQIAFSGRAQTNWHNPLAEALRQNRRGHYKIPNKPFFLDAYEMADWLWLTALAICGVFTLLLGSVHFFFPRLLDFAQAVPREGPPLKPFRLGVIRYPTQRSDVHGIAWVMNHAASYTLVSIGVVDLFAFTWLHTPLGRLVALWIAGWWFLRAASQLYLGHRHGDWWILAGFAWLGVVHVGTVF